VLSLELFGKKDAFNKGRACGANRFWSGRPSSPTVFHPLFLLLLPGLPHQTTVISSINQPSFLSPMANLPRFLLFDLWAKAWNSPLRDLRLLARSRLSLEDGRSLIFPPLPVFLWVFCVPAHRPTSEDPQLGLFAVLPRTTPSLPIFFLLGPSLLFPFRASPPPSPLSDDAFK